jgi:hypothetical protein
MDVATHADETEATAAAVEPLLEVKAHTDETEATAAAVVALGAKFEGSDGPQNDAEKGKDCKNNGHYKNKHLRRRPVKQILYPECKAQRLSPTWRLLVPPAVCPLH